MHDDRLVALLNMEPEKNGVISFRPNLSKIFEYSIQLINIIFSFH